MPFSMNTLSLHELHASLGASFTSVNQMEAVLHYGDAMAEFDALHGSVAVMDLGYRSRLCLLGADRKKFLHGQVTNRVNELQVGQGNYAALVTAKGKVQSDLMIYCLADELLLDFEPGLASAVSQRLEKYIIAEDVQVVDVSEAFGHLSVQGPRADEAVTRLDLGVALPAKEGDFVHQADAALGDLYLMKRARTGSNGYDLFAPTASLGMIFDKWVAAAKACGGRAAGWTALETARVEAAIPRYGVDMDETNLAPETGLEVAGIHYGKGCYIGQEVIARIRTYGQVAKSLRGIKMGPEAQVLPQKGDKIYWGDKEIGYVTSAIASPTLKTNVALSYLRREHNQMGDTVTVRTGDIVQSAVVATVPFRPFS